MKTGLAQVCAMGILLSCLSVVPLNAGEEEVKGAVPTQSNANDPNTEVYRLTDVLNKPVKDENGDEVGRIKDLVVNGRSREVLYAVVAMDDGKEKDALYVMPWTVFRPNYGQNAYQYTVLTIPQSVWIQAPFYSASQWGTLPFAQWGPRVNNYYSTHVTNNTVNNSKSQNVRVNRPSLDDEKGEKPKATNPKSGAANNGEKEAPKPKANPQPNPQPEPKAPEGQAPKPSVAPKPVAPKTGDPVIPKSGPPSPREPKVPAPNPR